MPNPTIKELAEGLDGFIAAGDFAYLSREHAEALRLLLSTGNLTAANTETMVCGKPMTYWLMLAQWRESNLPIIQAAEKMALNIVESYVEESGKRFLEGLHQFKEKYHAKI